ncbi:MAG: hypothetical protein ABH856_02845 [Patescibacteria group bacterium]
MNTKKKTQTQQTDLEALEEARKTEEHAPKEPETELQKLSREIVGTVSGGAEVHQDRLFEIQDKMNAMDDEKLDKLKGDVEAGLVAQLAIGEGVDAEGEAFQAFREKSAEIASYMIDGLLTDSDMEALLFSLRNEYAIARRRAELEAGFKESDSVLSEKIVGLLTAIGIYPLLSEDEQRSISKYTDSEDMNRYVRNITGRYGSKVGLNEEYDLDDLAVLTMYSEPEKGGKSILDAAAEKIPWGAEAKTFAEVVKHGDKVRAFREASEDLGVSKKTLRQFAHYTYGQLLDEMEGQNLEEGIYLEMSIIAEMVEMNRGLVEDSLESAILNIDNPDLTDADKLALVSEYNVDNMMLGDILAVVYGNDTEGNWLAHPLARGYAIYRGARYWRGDKSQKAWTNVNYLKGKLFREGAMAKETNDLVSAFRGIRNIADQRQFMLVGKAEGEAFQKMQAQFKSVQDNINGFLERVKGLDPKSFSADTLLERDRLFKQMSVASKNGTRVMSEVASSTLQAGQMIEMAEAGASKGSVEVAGLLKKMKRPEIGRHYIKTRLGLDAVPEVLTSAQIGKLRYGYMDDLARVKGTTEMLNEGMEAYTKELWKGSKKVSRVARKVGKGTVKGVENVKDYVTVTGRVKRLAPRVILLGSIVGSEVYAAATGKVGWDEAGWDLAEAGMGMVPILGTGLDFKTFATGKTLSGRKLGWDCERWSYLLFGVVGGAFDVLLLAGGLGAGLRVGVMGGRGVLKAGKGVRTATKFGSLPFRAGQKINNAVFALRKGGGRLTRYRKLDEMENALEYADLMKSRGKAEKLAGKMTRQSGREARRANKAASKAARRHRKETGEWVEPDKIEGTHHQWEGLFGEKPKHDRLGYLTDLKEGGALPASYASPGRLSRMTGWQHVRKGKVRLEKKFHRWLGIDEADIAKTKVLDDEIVVSRKRLFKAQGELDVKTAAKGERTVIENAEALVEKAKTDIHYARAQKFVHEAEREMRRIQAVQKYRHLDMVTNYVIKGGIVAGGMAALLQVGTGGHAEEVLDAAASVGKAGTDVAGWAAGEVMEDRSYAPPIQKAIAARIEMNRKAGKIEEMLYEAEENGQNPMDVWRDLLFVKNDQHAWQIARDEGILQQLTEMYGGQVAAGDVAWGDSGQKIKESVA